MQNASQLVTKVGLAMYYEKNFSKQTRETRAYAGLLSVELKEVWDPLHSVMVVEGLLFSNLAVGAKIMQIAELEKQIPRVF